MASVHRRDSIHLSAPLHLLASGPSALPSRFEGVAYSGGLVPSHNVVIDLASTTVPPRMPLLAAHDSSDVAGVIERAAGDGRQITVSGRLFSDIAGSSAERMAQVSQRGVPLQMSVGLYGFTEEAMPAGRSLALNGRQVAGPVTVLRGGTARETSIVTLGADWSAAVQLFGAGSGRSAEVAALFREIGAQQPAAAEIASLGRLSAAHFATLARMLRAQAQAVRLQEEKAAALREALDLNKIYARRRAACGRVLGN